MPTETGDALVIEVETAVPGTFVPVNDMNRFSRRTNRSTSRTRVFMRARPYTTRSAREWTATLSGYLNTDDAGQQLLRAGINTDVPVRLRILPDGVNGWEQEFYVGTSGHDANPDPTAMQEVSYELADAGDPVAVGTGPIL